MGNPALREPLGPDCMICQRPYPNGVCPSCVTDVRRDLGRYGKEVVEGLNYAGLHYLRLDTNARITKENGPIEVVPVTK